MSGEHIALPGTSGALEPAISVIKVCLSKMFAEVFALQRPSGIWHTQLEKEQSYEEASCELLFICASQLAQSEGVAIGDAAARFDACWDGTRAHFTEAGELLQVSGETWLRWQDPEGYECIETGHRPWGAGAALLAAATEGMRPK